MGFEKVPQEILFSKTLKFIVDNRGKSAPIEETGIELIKTVSISNDRLYPERLNLLFVSQSTYDNWFRAHPEPGDILVVNKGSYNGTVCLVPEPANFCIAQDMVAVRADEQVIDPLFLFAALRSRLVQSRIRDLNVSSAIPHFKKTDFNKLLLPYPDRETQEVIGQLYFQFSSKIELNRRMNQTLEAMSQAIFKSWFVDFEPVKAKQQARVLGEPVELAAMIALSGKSAAEIESLPVAQRVALAETAALFPERLVESELGLIPEGWGYQAIKDVTENVFDGPHATPKPSEEGAVFLGIKNFTGTSLDFTNLRRISDADWPKWTKRVTPKAEDIVFTYEATLGFFAMIPDWLRCCLGRRTALVRPLPEKGNAHFLLHTFISRPFQILLDAHVNYGSTVNRILLSEFPSYPILYPSEELAKQFSTTASNFWQEIHLNQQQNQNLTQLRDTLLPKLLSGELTIPEAMAQTGEVLS